jgi:hypothetical protein
VLLLLRAAAAVLLLLLMAVVVVVLVVLLLVLLLVVVVLLLVVLSLGRRAKNCTNGTRESRERGRLQSRSVTTRPIAFISCAAALAEAGDLDDNLAVVREGRKPKPPTTVPMSQSGVLSPAWVGVVSIPTTTTSSSTTTYHYHQHQEEQQHQEKQHQHLHHHHHHQQQHHQQAVPAYSTGHHQRPLQSHPLVLRIDGDGDFQLVLLFEAV